MSNKEKEILYYIKNEKSSDLLYHMAVAVIERLAQMDKGSAIKAILDAGTANLYKMVKRQ